MSNAFQFFIGENGFRILFDPSTGKKYTLLENNYSIGNLNYQLQSENYENYHNGNRSQMQNMEQNNYNVPQAQQMDNIANHIYRPSLMSTTPNQIHETRPPTTCQNIHTQNPLHFVYRQKNTSTPTQSRQEQECRNGTEAHVISQNETVSNNKRSLNESDEFITVVARNNKKKNEKTSANQSTLEKNLDSDVPLSW